MLKTAMLTFALPLAALLIGAGVANASDNVCPTSTGCAAEAPLPLLGATPFAFGVICSGVALVMRRRSGGSD